MSLPGLTNEIQLMAGAIELLDSYTLGFYELEEDADVELLLQPEIYINVTVTLLRKQVSDGRHVQYGSHLTCPQ